MNANKLKGKIIECGESVESFSKKIKINKSTFYRKIQNKSHVFTIKEATLIAKKLNLTHDDIIDIFFTD